MKHAWRRADAVLIAGLAAVLLAACGSSVPTQSPQPTNSPVPSASATPDLTAAASLVPIPTPVPTAAPTPTPDLSDLTKRPFTVLILGWDLDHRTDSMIVAGIDPTKGHITFASLPRDTIDVPLPTGGIYKNLKVNDFYNDAEADPGNYPKGPGRATADMMQLVTGVRIEYYAVTSFDGFKNLVNAMGGVNVNVPSLVVDPNYQITTTNVGIRFDPGPQVMNGDRAIIYARTRQGDSDFQRSRRQQVILASAGKQVAAHPELLLPLVGAAANLKTDFPLGQLPGLLATMMAAPDRTFDMGTVFSPVQSATTIPYSQVVPCPCGYALEPNLPLIKATAAQLFPWAVITP